MTSDLLASVSNGRPNFVLFNTEISDDQVALIVATPGARDKITLLICQLKISLLGLMNIIRSTSNLQIMHIIDTEIGDHGVELLCHELRNLKKLHTLDLLGTGMSDTGLVALARTLERRHLTNLNISRNKFTDAGFEALVHATIKCGLNRLCIVSNPGVTDAGAQFLTAVLILPNCFLTEVTFGGTAISPNMGSSIRILLEKVQIRAETAIGHLPVAKRGW